MDSAPEQKSFAQKLQERLAASRFFTFSLLLHVILIILGGSVVIFRQFSEPPDFEGSGGLVSTETAQAPAPEEPPSLAQESFEQEQPSISAPSLSVVTAATTTTTNFTMAAAPISRGIATNITKLTDTSKVLAKSTGMGGIPGGMGNRMGAGGQGRGRAANGGKDKSEKAVLAGLRWLKEHQNADGSWSSEYTPAMTGLAMLCYLGHGELPESPEFGPTVKKALDWILAKGKASQGKMATIEGANSGVYEHAILTYAMGEYYSMTKDERFADVLKEAVGYIVKGQTSMGGWDYHYKNAGRNDLSVAGWQIQALKAAHLTGLDIPGVDAALDKSMGFIKKMQGNEGGFGYVQADNRWSLTGVGVLCTYFWKQDKDATVKEGIDFLLGKATDVQYKSEKADLYAWYYHTQACLMYGGQAWSKWNKLFQDQVADSQSPDGSWPPLNAKGHGNLQSKGDGGGPVYRTTLCILMLEVFYRYMPINK